MNLPIELVPGPTPYSPPHFRWQQVVDGRAVDHTGMMPPSLEDAVKSLIELAGKLLVENAGLRGKLALQTEMLKEKDRNVPTPAKRVKA